MNLQGPVNVSGQLRAAATLKAEDKQDRQCTHKRKNEARSCNHSSRAKPTSMAYSECVSVVLVIQHAMRMRRITLSSVACLVLPYVYELFHKWDDLGGGGGMLPTQNVCFDFVCNFCLKHF